MRSGLSRSQLAVLAGVPTSTVTRIESGEASPSLAMVDRLVAAAGFDLDVSLTRRADLSAITAARRVLDPRFPAALDDGGWIDRWTAMGVLRDGGEPRSPSELCRRAGSSASLTARPGAIAWTATASSDPSAVASRLCAAVDGLAVSGGVAANRLRRSADAPWLIVYCDDPAALGGVPGLVPSDGPVESGVAVLALPFDPTSKLGVWKDDLGARWVDPLQVVIDCYAGNGRMPDQADLVLDAVGVR